jgi:hypothetical protein
MYGRLVTYKNQHGDCNVPSRWKQDRPLATWVDTQRQRKDELPPERIQRLDALGFDWEPSSTYWEQMYGRLVVYKKSHGDCNVPLIRGKNRGLANWVSVNRQRKNQLLPDRIQRLEKLGFDWNPLKTYWEQMYERLVVYKKSHGNCNVPQRWEQDRLLAAWVITQRQRKDQLLPDRIQRLEKMGFDWNPLKTYWDQMYGRLVTYRKQHGDCKVPGGWKQDRPLATWVNTQRHRKDQLPPERIQRLEKLGFDWDPIKTYWDQMYGRLVTYKKQHEHCNVTREWKDRRLATWVTVQRNHKDRLTPERIQWLDALGFAWNPRNARWEKMYGRLAVYKKQHGHCNIPQIWAQDPPLGFWIQSQRQMKKKGHLSSERIRLLNALRFEWDLKRTGRRRERQTS